MPVWGEDIRGSVLSTILIIAMLGAIGTPRYVIAAPKVGERFTEFYVIGLDGKTVDYFKGLKVGEEGRVIVRIVNHEKEGVSYWVGVRIDGVRNNEVESTRLGDEPKWEEVVGFTPNRVGDNQKVEFLLHKNGKTEPYLKPLHLWINVKE